MIDYFNEIYTAIRTVVGNTADVRAEYISVPSDFPTVTVEEISNVPTSLDNGTQKYAAITYRIQVFSNKKNGKRAEARSIYKTVSDKMYQLNLIGKTYTATPDIYNSNIYEIQGTFEGIVDSNGNLYRRK